MMNKYLDMLRKVIPVRFQSRRFLLDQYHFDLSSIEGDVGDWLARFPIENQNIEIYLALAELFRRRGEFDKAVTIHEAIARAPVSGYSHSELQLEIAQDYYAAGMLGHAEVVLVDALEGADDIISSKAFRLWLSILEHEQEWGRSVELVEQYGVKGSGGLRLANLYCEHASELLDDHSMAAAQKVLKKARKLEVGVRALLMSAEILTQQNRVADAIQLYREALINKPARISLVLQPLKRLSLLNGTEVQLLKFLQDLYQLHPSVRILEVMLDISAVLGRNLPEEWRRLVAAQVKEGNSSLVYQYWMRHFVSVPDHVIAALEPALEKHSLSETDVHLCTECGFYSEKLVWQCPQCDSWETIYSQYELKIVQQIKKHT